MHRLISAGVTVQSRSWRNWRKQAWDWPSLVSHTETCSRPQHCSLTWYTCSWTITYTHSGRQFQNTIWSLCVHIFHFLLSGSLSYFLSVFSPSLFFRDLMWKSSSTISVFTQLTETSGLLWWVSMSSNYDTDCKPKLPHSFKKKIHKLITLQSNWGPGYNYGM